MSVFRKINLSWPTKSTFGRSGNSHGCRKLPGITQVDAPLVVAFRECSACVGFGARNIVLTGPQSANPPCASGIDPGRRQAPGIPVTNRGGSMLLDAGCALGSVLAKTSANDRNPRMAIVRTMALSLVNSCSQMHRPKPKSNALLIVTRLRRRSGHSGCRFKTEEVPGLLKHTTAAFLAGVWGRLCRKVGQRPDQPDIVGDVRARDERALRRCCRRLIQE